MAFSALPKEEIVKEPEQQLKTFKKTRDFLVAIDTDGCVVDNMNGKQMLIFHPQYMEFFDLWEIESYVREIAEYYNLFSISRGCNRFLAIQHTLRDLYQRQDVLKAAKEHGVRLPPREPLESYVKDSTEKSVGLGNPSLEKFLAARSMDFSLYKLLGWSEAVNRTFPFINPRIPLFENVRESLRLVADHADIVVVSQTPYDDLLNYWTTQNVTQYITLIAGQEMGSKGHHLEVLKKAAGYADDHVLMIGDADGDLKAVKKNNSLFYPIPAGREREAWKTFPDAFKSFLNAGYDGAREGSLLEAFAKVLLTVPPWETAGYDHAAAYREKQPIRKTLYQALNPTGRLLIL